MSLPRIRGRVVELESGWGFEVLFTWDGKMKPMELKPKESFMTKSMATTAMKIAIKDTIGALENVTGIKVKDILDVKQGKQITVDDIDDLGDKPRSGNA